MAEHEQHDDAQHQAQPRIESDLAFAAAGLSREVAFEVTTAHLASRLVEHGLGVAMLPSAFARQLTGVTTVEVVDAPARVEYVIWNRDGRTPAATAFLDLLDITAEPGTG